MLVRKEDDPFDTQYRETASNGSSSFITGQGSSMSEGGIGTVQQSPLRRRIAPTEAHTEAHTQAGTTHASSAPAINEVVQSSGLKLGLHGSFFTGYFMARSDVDMVLSLEDDEMNAQIRYTTILFP